MTVDEDEHGNTRIVRVGIEAVDGAAIGRDALRLLAAFGFDIPAGPARRRGARRQAETLFALPEAGTAEETPATRPGSGSRVRVDALGHYRMPDVEEMQALVAEHGSGTRTLAAVLGVPPKTAGNWIYNLRRRKLIAPAERRGRPSTSSNRRTDGQT